MTRVTVAYRRIYLPTVAGAAQEWALAIDRSHRTCFPVSPHRQTAAGHLKQPAILLGRNKCSTEDVMDVAPFTNHIENTGLVLDPFSFCPL